MHWRTPVDFAPVLLVLLGLGTALCQGEPLRLSWDRDMLTISGPDLPGHELKIH